jgi:enediyne biosynthesis protein E4
LGITVVTVTRQRPPMAALVLLILLLTTIALVLRGLVAVEPVTGGELLCRNVAAERGLTFRGAYGPTPFAVNPMAVMMLRNMGNGAAVADVFDDGNLSVLLLGQIGHPNRLFRSEPGPDGVTRFVDITEEAGLANSGGSRVAAFADLDADGELDLVVLNDWDGDTAGSPSRIYRNGGDRTFEDVTEGSGFAPVGWLVGGLSLADYNRDGLLDLFVTYWTMELGGDPSRAEIVKGQFSGHNRLYENLGGFRFRDVTRESGLGVLSADSFSSVFADLTGNGWPDIYVAIDHRADILYENEGGTFRRVSRELGIGHVGNDMGIAVTDLESNGLLDLYATNISDPTGQFGNSQGNTFLIARPGPDGRPIYTDLASSLGVDDTGWGWGAAFVDLDLDGLLDLYAVQGMQEFIADQSPELRAESARLFLNRGNLSFEAATGNGCDIEGDQRTVVPLDYNRDGAPDLLITQVAYSTVLLENQTSGRHWLTIDLSRAGAQAAGARVKVSAGDEVTTQVALYGGSYLAGMPLELYFGLGALDRADDVVVTWADGTTTSLGPVPGDQVLRVTPPGARP